MKIYSLDKGDVSFELSEEERRAFTIAKLKVNRRAKEEEGKYDEQMLEWRLYGILREKGTEGMIKWAKEAPFQQKEYSTPVGYSY